MPACWSHPVGRVLASLTIMSVYDLLIFVALGASMLVQVYLRNTFGKWNNVGNSRDITGAEVARQMLDENGLGEVKVEAVAGNLSDHYDPRVRVVRLSESTHSVPSVAAIAVAAHEVGHAIQHQTKMPALVIRGKMAVPLSIGQNLAPWLFMAGFSLQLAPLTWLGVGLFGFAMLFHLVTLPVEFDASRRALVYIRERGLLVNNDNLGGAQKVLTAAALTYVASFAMSLLQFLRFLRMVRR